MRNPPAVATAVLTRLGPPDESFFGDLVEEYASGRSRTWYWRQVLSAVVLTAVRQAGAHPVRALAALATGWGTLLLAFLALGDRTAEAVAGWAWDWERQTAYATRVWWPFQITAVFVSYAGFASSALVVVRVHGRQAGALLSLYAGSVFLVLAALAVLIDVLGPVAVPHALFYVVSVALPYQWRSGLLLAPAIVLIAGLLACPSTPEARSSASIGAERE